MANPFMRNYWNSSHSHPRYYNPPHDPTIPKPSKPKVVSIPVHFVGSEEKKKPVGSTATARSMAAVKIQKVFRGFLVRKNADKVRTINTEVDEIERRIRSELDLILRDTKERLRVNEMLMGLLLRLDSVRGVREFRKKVIRRVIVLQEAVDSISAGEKVVVEDVSDGAETPGLGDGAPDQTLVQQSETLEAVEKTGSQEFVEIPKESQININEGEDGIMTEETLEITVQTGAETLETESRAEEEASLAADSKEEEAPEREDLADLMEETNLEIIQEPASTPEAEEAPEIPRNLSPSAEEEGSLGTLEIPPNHGKEGDGGMREVMERMVEENSKLKGMLAELCERSAMQCRLMSGLSERVEQLERVVQRRERKKKKRCDRKKENSRSLML